MQAITESARNGNSKQGHDIHISYTGLEQVYLLFLHSCVDEYGIP